MFLFSPKVVILGQIGNLVPFWAKIRQFDVSGYLWGIVLKLCSITCYYKSTIMIGWNCPKGTYLNQFTKSSSLYTNNKFGLGALPSSHGCELGFFINFNMCLWQDCNVHFVHKFSMKTFLLYYSIFSKFYHQTLNTFWNIYKIICIAWILYKFLFSHFMTSWTMKIISANSSGKTKNI